MKSTKVSVILPTYNHAKYLAAAVCSVLNQTYADFELIVVNDGSKDHTDDVIAQFTDSRLKYIKHQENRYAAAARNTGIRASSGDLISFFDGDDLMHPEKLQEQVDFLEEHPEIGLSYTGRFEIDQNDNLLSIYKPPSTINLSDLVMSYPYAPSEVVIRKEWVTHVGLFDESFLFHGEDPEYFIRLARQDCAMAGIDRALSYRRRHTGRIFNNLRNVIKDALRPFENIFSDPSCPQEILGLKDRSLAKIHLIWSYIAFNQNETALGQDLIRKSIRLDRSILDIKGDKLVDFLVMTSIREGGDHEVLLRRIFAQFPPELEWLTLYLESSIAYGYVLRGTREIVIGRTTTGIINICRSGFHENRLYKSFYYIVTDMLLNFENEFGIKVTLNRLQNVSTHLIKISNRKDVRFLKGHYFVNQAFKDYDKGQHKQVIQNLIRAIVTKPGYIMNRGVIARLAHSIIKTIKPGEDVFL